MTSTLFAIAVGSVLLGLFAHSAASGVGLPYRLVQYVYYSFGSLDAYQKRGETHDSLTDILASEEPTLVGSVIGTVAPSQAGWFAARFPTDKGTFHGYAETYDALFSPYRRTEGLRLLEVGVKKGGSLALWREFFSPSAFIYGVDVHPGVPRFSLDAHIKVLIMDSRDATCVGRALQGMDLDIIIDDGLHHPDAQRQTYAALRPFLKASGVYVIEDVYRLRPEDYEAYGDDLTVVPDKSGQSLVMLRPSDSYAPRLGTGEARNNAGE